MIRPYYLWHRQNALSIPIYEKTLVHCYLHDCLLDKRRAQDGGIGAAITTFGQVRHMALADYKYKKGLSASIIGVFCDCDYITDDDGFDSKLNFRLPFYTLLEGFWKFHTDGETYREKMIELSIKAFTNMEESPLFVRFVSLLIDDTNTMMGHGMK